MSRKTWLVAVRDPEGPEGPVVKVFRLVSESAEDAVAWVNRHFPDRAPGPLTPHLQGGAA